MKLVNHCDDHRVYAAGCEACKVRSKAYREYRKANPARPAHTTMWGPPEHWKRMTEIGLRHEGKR